MISGTHAAAAAALRTSGGLHLLTWSALEASGADAAVTARSGGVSSGPYATLNLSLSVGDNPANVLENRRRLAAAFGASSGEFVFARQVHGAGVRVVGPADRGSGALSLDDAIDGVDALVTTSPGVVLAILAADCVPIVLHDPVAGVLACVHAGWRGTTAGVAAAALAVMQSLGTRPSDVIAGIGPAIAADRYQVGPDVHLAVTRSFGPAADAFMHPDPPPVAAPKPATPRSHPDCPTPPDQPNPPGRWLLDLRAANRHALRQAGVPDPQIHTTSFPTGPLSTGAVNSAATAVPASPATRTHADPTDPTSDTSPTDPTSDPSPTDPTSPATLTDPTGPGCFFSDRYARPCGRLALVARLRTRGRTSLEVALS